MAQSGWVALATGCSGHQVRLGKVWGGMQRHRGAGGLGLLRPRSPVPAPCPRPLPARRLHQTSRSGRAERGRERERESQSRGRGRRSLPPPHSSSGMNLGQLLSGLGMPEGDAPAWVWGRRFHFSPRPPSWPAARCLCPVPPSRPRHSPYILPSSERMIFRRPQGG